MSKRCVILTAVHKRVPLGAYVQAVKYAKAHPDAVFKHGLTTWWPVTGSEIVKEFRQGMHDRITRGVPRSAAWPGR